MTFMKHEIFHKIKCNLKLNMKYSSIISCLLPSNLTYKKHSISISY